MPRATPRRPRCGRRRLLCAGVCGAARLRTPSRRRMIPVPLEWPDPALKVRDRARFARCTACSPRLSDDACRVPAELGARGAAAPAREGAGAAAAGGRTARQPTQQRAAQRPPAQQPEQPVRALRGEYCRPAALRRLGGSTRSNFASRARAEARAAPARPAASRRRRNMAIVQPLRRRKRLAGSAVCRRGGSFGC